MATVTRKKEPEISTNSSCQVFLSGKVAPHVQANIIKELLKHLMFQRNQIPLPFEQMKFEYQRHIADKEKQGERLKLSSTVLKRLGQLVTSVEEQLSQVDTLFTLSRVPCVLILFGATAVSPKEVHEVSFANQASALDSSLPELRTRHCLRALMRTLIADSPLWEARQLPLTNTLLLVRARRDSGLVWFQPKVALRVPRRRGQGYSYTIHCGRAGPVDAGPPEDLAPANGVRDSCADADTAASYSAAADGKGSAHKFPEDSESDDYIWYQAPVPIKGVQPFASKAPSSSDIWA